MQGLAADQVPHAGWIVAKQLGATVCGSSAKFATTMTLRCSRRALEGQNVRVAGSHPSIQPPASPGVAFAARSGAASRRKSAPR